MKFRSLVLGAIAAGMIIASATSAMADKWDDLNAYLRTETGIGDFTLNKSQFGNSNYQVVVNAGIALVAAKYKGYTIAYSPYDPGSPFIAGTPAVPAVFIDTGNTFAGKIVYANSKCKLLSGRTALGNPDADGICLPADTLVGNNGGAVKVKDAIAAGPDTPAVPSTPRTCSVTVNGINKTYSC